MATLSQTNNYLEALVEAGADAQQNLFVAQFIFQNNSPNNNDPELDEALTVRCTSFDPPQVSHSGKYTNKFLTAYIPRPAAKVTVDRHFDLSFRVDSNYFLYKRLLLQQNVTFNAGKSFAASDIQALIDTGSAQLFDVEIYTVPAGMTNFYNHLGKEDGYSLGMYGFRNCWITKIDPLPLNMDQAEAQVVKLSCNFIQMEDRQSITPVYS